MKKIFTIVFRKVVFIIASSACLVFTGCSSDSISTSADTAGSYDFVHSNSEVAYSHKSSGLHIISMADTILYAMPQDDFGEGKTISAADLYSSGWDADIPGPFVTAPPRGVLTYTNSLGVEQNVDITVNNVIAMSNHVVGSANIRCK